MEFLADLRRSGVDSPIIILSARAGEFDRVAGLRAGADDYIVKPCGALELRERIRLQLRKAAARPRQLIQLGTVVVDLELHIVVRDEQRFRRSAQEGRVLTVLWRAGGKCVTREQLLIDAWGYKRPTPTRTVDFCIGSLRRKIEIDPKHPQYLITVARKGYCLRIDKQLPQTPPSTRS